MRIAGTLFTVTVVAMGMLIVANAEAQIVAYDMVGSSSQNLTSYTNPYTGAFSSPADGFQKYRRGVSPSIPFAVLDDSLVIFPGDTQGIITNGNTDEFFGIVDTINSDNFGPVSATWTFDVAGAAPLVLSIDMGAMGDFESSDVFEWSYSIDGGPTQVAFQSTVDEAGSHTYILEGGGFFTLNDPMLVSGTILTNNLQTFSTALAGTGSSLSLTLTVTTNGTEAIAFQNIVVSEDPTFGIAFDMVGSTSRNLTSFTNPYTGFFSSPADGFQKYRRGVSPSIPFAVLDDSLVIFPGDTLGIIKDGNLDEFFGVVDTINSDNTGPVSATWTFNVVGASALMLSIDMGAMGDFESSDVFEWSYSIDGGPTQVAFQSTVDEAGSYTYTLEGGASFTLNDPMLVNGTTLTNNLQTFTAPLVGSGTTLTLTLTVTTNGTEAIAFQNIVVGLGNPPPPPSTAEIFEIQGDGLASPYDGLTIQTLDNIVTAVAPEGFFMQTPEARADADPDTSNGIFVFTGGPPSVAVGDQVDVTGEIAEFFNFTEFTIGSIVTVDSSGNPLPAAVALDAATPSPAQPQDPLEFERLEGMLVTAASGVVTGPNQRFGTDPVAEVHIVTSPNRAFREPGIEYPGWPAPPVLPVWDGNPEVFELDPDRLGLVNQVIPAGSTFSAAGVIGFEFGGYELWPTSLSVVPATIPRPVRQRAPGEITIGSLNLFRLFDDVDDPADGSGRDDLVDAAYDTRRAKLAAYIVDVLDAPDVLAVQEAEKIEVLQALAADIAGLDATVTYEAHLIEGNDSGTIDVGFLLRSDRIAVDAVTQLGAAETLTVDGTPLHDRPPLLLEGGIVGTAVDSPLAVMVVHSRSLSGIDDPDPVGNRTRQKRLEQAQSIAQMVQDFQTVNPTIPLIVIGDFNAFEFSDGYVDVVGQVAGDLVPTDNLVSGPDLVDPNLTVHTLSIPAGERYSLIYQGNSQAIDHALTTSNTDEWVRGVEYGRGNADAAVDLINDGTTSLRSSDHDGLVLYLMTDGDGDSVPDDLDNCPDLSNPDQADGDGDGIGDLCDACFDLDAPILVIASQSSSEASGTATDCTGIQEVRLAPGSSNLQLSTTGVPGDPGWSWHVTLVDFNLPASGAVEAIDLWDNTSSVDIALRTIGIPTLSHAAMLLLALIFAAVGVALLRRS